MGGIGGVVGLRRRVCGLVVGGRREVRVVAMLSENRVLMLGEMWR